MIKTKKISAGNYQYTHTDGRIFEIYSTFSESYNDTTWVWKNINAYYADVSFTTKRDAIKALEDYLNTEPTVQCVTPVDIVLTHLFRALQMELYAGNTKAGANIVLFEINEAFDLMRYHYLDKAK